jgi:hypothetical protein
MFVYYFSKLHLHHFSKIKSLKEVTKQGNEGFSSCFCLMIEETGSGSGQRTVLVDPDPGGPVTYGSESPTLDLTVFSELQIIFHGRKSIQLLSLKAYSNKSTTGTSLTFKIIKQQSGFVASNLNEIIPTRCGFGSRPEKNTQSYIFIYVPDVGRMSCNRSSAPPPSAVPAVFGQSAGDLDLFDEESEIEVLVHFLFSPDFREV